MEAKMIPYAALSYYTTISNRDPHHRFFVREFGEEKPIDKKRVYAAALNIACEHEASEEFSLVLLRCTVLRSYV